MERGIGICPISSMKDLLENPQLVARDFWVDVMHPKLGESITYPGTSMILSETPSKISRRAPLTGEHNQEIYRAELGFTEEELHLLRKRRSI
jgi:crotonobetainyl-CoA:carnitine CoA-transferase CaiB-like acyl-CoA transferase